MTIKFVISPAKSLDYESAALTDKASIPKFMQDSAELIDGLRKLTADDVKALMGVSDNIAELNVQRYADWQPEANRQNAKQAVYAFTGDVYTGLSIQTAEQAQVDYVDEHVCILSGLYGMLRPLDLMQAYRLEMGTKFENQRGANLYKFWGDSVTDHLNTILPEESPVLVNLASNEYFKVINKKKLQARIVTPVFKDLKGDTYKIVSFYAKKARGLMVRYAADHLIEDPERLKQFDYAGYRFNESMSDEDNWVFTRDEPVK